MTQKHTGTPNRLSAAPRPHDPWRHGEPTLDDALNDPIVHLLMGRDRLSVDRVRSEMIAVRRRLCQMTQPPTARAA